MLHRLDRITSAEEIRAILRVSRCYKSHGMKTMKMSTWISRGNTAPPRCLTYGNPCHVVLSVLFVLCSSTASPFPGPRTTAPKRSWLHMQDITRQASSGDAIATRSSPFRSSYDNGTQHLMMISKSPKDVFR